MPVKLLEVFPERRPIAFVMPEKPLVLPYRRARSKRDWTITLRGELFKTDPLDQFLLPKLTGESTVKNCIDSVREAVELES